MPVFLDTSQAGFEAAFARLLSMKRESAPDVDADVAAILADVRGRGDEAVIDYTARWDRLNLTAETMRVSNDDIATACAEVPSAEREALAMAADRIRSYHERQLPADIRWSDAHGAELGWRWTAVDSAGLYVPGGQASYPSSVLMNAIPARVAGVGRLVMCAPTPDGEFNPLVLLAARMSGVDEVYRIGGAQAIGAMAFGTESSCARRQDHRTRQCLRRSGEAQGVRACRYRHDRGAVRSADHCGCRQSSGLACP